MNSHLLLQAGQRPMALPVGQVREIASWQKTAPIPGTPPSFLGLTNLRGHLMPVLDLGRRLGLAPIQPDDRSCFIVVNAPEESAANEQVALAVQSVQTVLDLGELRPVPSLGMNVDIACVQGVAIYESMPVLALNLTPLLGAGTVAASLPLATTSPLPAT